MGTGASPISPAQGELRELRRSVREAGVARAAAGGQVRRSRHGYGGQHLAKAGVPRGLGRGHAAGEALMYGMAVSTLASPVLVSPRDGVV